MANQVQVLRRIGACENKQAQADWSGPEISACPAPAAFLCEVCGRLLCGSHAGGHFHASDASAIASHFQSEASQARADVASAQKTAAGLQAQLQAARADSALLDQVRTLVKPKAKPAA